MRNSLLSPLKGFGRFPLVCTEDHSSAKNRLSTGIRALDHAVETLYRPSIVPPLKILCYGAIVDLFKYLPMSKADPNDIHARQKLQVAAWMSLWPVRPEKYR
jgi:Iron-containing alcohol dehydrogenase